MATVPVDVSHARFDPNYDQRMAELAVHLYPVPTRELLRLRLERSGHYEHALTVDLYGLSVQMMIYLLTMSEGELLKFFAERSNTPLPEPQPSESVADPQPETTKPETLKSPLFETIASLCGDQPVSRIFGWVDTTQGPVYVVQFVDGEYAFVHDVGDGSATVAVTMNAMDAAQLAGDMVTKDTRESARKSLMEQVSAGGPLMFEG